MFAVFGFANDNAGAVAHRLSDISHRRLNTKPASIEEKSNAQYRQPE